MPRKQINVHTETYLLVDKLRGNKTFDEIVHLMATRFRKFKEENSKLKVEIERLKEQVPTTNEAKEAWKQRVEAEGHLPLLLSDFEVPCHYRAVTSKGDLYCDDKKMAKEVCIRRQKRHLAMKRMCMPSALKKKRKSTFSPNLWQPKNGVKGDTRLYRG